MTWLEELREARRRSGTKDPTARYAQLATVEAGEPRCRTLVVRGVDPEAGEIAFVSDLRAGKGSQLAARPTAELCWYLPRPRVQLRLRGPVRRLDGAGTAAAWRQLSPGARGPFLGPPPGTPRLPDDAFPPRSEDPEPPDAFGAYRLRVERADVLHLRPSPQVRTLYLRDGDGWSATPLRP
jgi:pyridoxamine 5'-phosphate oxidase